MAIPPPSMDALSGNLVTECQRLQAECERLTAERDELKARVRRLELERAQACAVLSDRVLPHHTAALDCAQPPREEPTTQALVLEVLAKCREIGGDHAWMLVTELARRTGRTKSTIQHMVKKLLKKRAIQAIEAPRTSSGGMPPRAYALAGEPMPTWFTASVDLCEGAMEVLQVITRHPKTAAQIRNATLLDRDDVTQHLKTLRKSGLAKSRDGAWVVA